MIELKNVGYTYEDNASGRVEAVKDVSVKIEDGEFWGIIGHTGSGKSTLTELMSGLLKPTEGSVIVDGIDVKNTKNTVRELKGKVAMVFQYPEHQLFEETVLKDICFGPKNLGLDENEAIKQAKAAMKLVELGEEYENLSPFELSGGEKRRVAIAGILAMKPDVLILDEPTAGLDPAGRDSLIDTLVRIQGEWTKSVVMVSHSMEDVARCAKKVMVMKKGRLIKSGDVGDVFKDEKLLTDAGLDIPQITRLMTRLRAEGFEFEDILTVEDAVNAICERIGV